MKTVLGIVSVLIVLLITVFILKRQKKCSSCSSKETIISKPKTPEQEKQQPEIESTAKIAVNSEAIVVNSQVTDMTSISSPVAESVSNIEISVKPQVKEAADSPVENSSSGFPQDSILRRHYFTHLCTMIEALAPECPTDSILCRHYYMMLLTEIDRCLNDKKAMERLIYDYENLSA
ncbi:hypothetical protein [Methylobacter tundripaludum]|uniref:hypothetical protein n=1 Tax=Methylobacter tundripaludum TaxID=173365 RepID=UPI00055C5DF5|nr:hypothetical protein [Methylobacter tundripaludum]